MYVCDFVAQVLSVYNFLKLLGKERGATGDERRKTELGDGDSSLRPHFYPLCNSAVTLKTFRYVFERGDIKEEREGA